MLRLPWNQEAQPLPRTGRPLQSPAAAAGAHSDAPAAIGIVTFVVPEPAIAAPLLEAGATSDGEAVDFRASPPTWRNLLLRRA
jgi:hypothetical protein